MAQNILEKMEKPMISATFHFTNGFLWGTATASHQVEGTIPTIIGSNGNRKDILPTNPGSRVIGGVGAGRKISTALLTADKTPSGCRLNGAGSNQHLSL